MDQRVCLGWINISEIINYKVKTSIYLRKRQLTVDFSYAALVPQHFKVICENRVHSTETFKKFERISQDLLEEQKKKKILHLQRLFGSPCSKAGIISSAPCITLSGEKSIHREPFASLSLLYRSSSWVCWFPLEMCQSFFARQLLVGNCTHTHCGAMRPWAHTNPSLWLFSRKNKQNK